MLPAHAVGFYRPLPVFGFQPPVADQVTRTANTLRVRMTPLEGTVAKYLYGIEDDMPAAQAMLRVYGLIALSSAGVVMKALPALSELGGQLLARVSPRAVQAIASAGSVLIVTSATTMKDSKVDTLQCDAPKDTDNPWVDCQGDSTHIVFVPGPDPEAAP